MPREGKGVDIFSDVVEEKYAWHYAKCEACAIFTNTALRTPFLIEAGYTRTNALKSPIQGEIIRFRHLEETADLMHFHLIANPSIGLFKITTSLFEFANLG